MLMSDGGGMLIDTAIAAGNDDCEYTAAVASVTVMGRCPPDVNVVFVFSVSAMVIFNPALLTV
jgi:hypothetical protein